MRERILFISEALSAPFDEGIKNVAFSIHKQLEKTACSLSVTKKGNSTEDINVLQVRLNKLFLNNKLRKLIKNYSPDVILYLPEASVTFNSFARAKILKFMCRSSEVVVLGVKATGHSCVQKAIIKYVRPDLLLLLGRFDKGFFQSKGLKVKVLPPAVDSVKFCQATKAERDRIRAGLNIPINKTVVLHVGHIRKTRNVVSLAEVQKLENVQVVVVGSTSTEKDGDIKNKLMQAGVMVIDDYVPDIVNIYKMSDIYVFPVFNEIACIEMPLSVFEAMACNLPIITTKFGSLEDYFEEDAGFRYFDTIENLVNLVSIVKNMDKTELHNNKKVEPFTWDRFAFEAIAACDNSI